MSSTRQLKFPTFEFQPCFVCVGSRYTHPYACLMGQKGVAWIDFGHENLVRCNLYYRFLSPQLQQVSVLYV